ncbi:MAG: FkbM family methyltransferase [Paracoccaceae bacterium]
MTPAVRDTLARIKAGKAWTGPALSLTHCQIRGQQITFCTAMEKDPIQRKNRAGAFYETSDLYLLDPYFPKGGTFVDIGANIGNHSLYFALVLGAALVIPVEPNPTCWQLLIENVLVNSLWDRFDLTRLGVGAGEARAGGYGMERRTQNIGAAAMVPGEGQLEVWRGDDLLEGITPDFIKIDVEGAELAALRGLSGVIARHRPNLFVEVAEDNDAGFHAWVAQADYRVELTRTRYLKASNYLVVPASAS